MSTILQRIGIFRQVQNIVESENFSPLRQISERTPDTLIEIYLANDIFYEVVYLNLLIFM
jgi:hypothetical protein